MRKPLGGYGNLYIDYQVEFPTNMSEEAAKEIAQVLH